MRWWWRGLSTRPHMPKAKKIKSLTLHTLGCPWGSLRDCSSSFISSSPSTQNMKVEPWKGTSPPINMDPVFSSVTSANTYHFNTAVSLLHLFIITKTFQNSWHKGIFVKNTAFGFYLGQNWVQNPILHLLEQENHWVYRGVFVFSQFAGVIITMS